MGKQVHLNDAQAAAVFNLIDAYLRTESVGEDLTDLFVVRAKVNHLWGFEDVRDLGRFDADRVAADADQPANCVDGLCGRTAHGPHVLHPLVPLTDENHWDVECGQRPDCTIAAHHSIDG